MELWSNTMGDLLTWLYTMGGTELHDGNLFIMLVCNTLENILSKQIIQSLAEKKLLPKAKRCHQQVYNIILWCWKESLNSRPSFNRICSDLSGVRHSCRMYTLCMLTVDRNYETTIPSPSYIENTKP